MEPNIQSQWTWPDTPEYLKAFKYQETEIAKTRRLINRWFLYLGIACAVAMGLITLLAFYYSIYK